jgi:GNAT superfamily N-acetyltransferase
MLKSRPAMVVVSYRKARQEDIQGIARLIRTSIGKLQKQHGFSEISPFAVARQPPIPKRIPWFELGLKEDSEGFWVAQVKGELAGIALAWVRGSLWYLAHLFVSPRHQGLNIGQELLNRAYKHHRSGPITNRALATFAYNPVSISLYARYGMFPREPLYWMECQKQQVKSDKIRTALKNVPQKNFKAARKILNRIDLENTGYPREKNHEYLSSLPTVRCHLFSSGNKPVGYSYVWQNGRVGPIAASSKKTFTDMVKVSLRLAAEEETQTVGMLVTGPNEALMRIALENKMRIADNFLFMAAKPFPNFNNYLMYPTGAML